MVHQSTSLQLCIELDVNGLEIVKQSLKAGANYAVILEELKGYRDAWLSFRFGPPLSLQQPVANSVLPHQSGQCHGEAYFKPFRVPEVGEDMNQPYPFNRIRVTNICSPTNSDLPLDFKRPFRSFFADSKQDLVVLIDHEDVSFTRVDIHLNHLSTTEPHSLARSPTLTVRFEELDEEPHFHYGGAWIMEHILVMRFTPASTNNHRICDNIAIWDWQSGLFLGRIISKTSSIKPTFIDKNNLLFLSHTSEFSSSFEPTQDQVALLVYHIPSAPAVSAQEPLVADCYMPSCPSLQPTLILELPRLDPKYRVLRPILWDTLAGPGDLAWQRSAQVVHSCVKTVALSICVVNKPPSRNKSQRASPTRYSIFISTDSILGHLSKNRSQETVTIVWSDWGTTATRWFMDRDWVSDNAKIHGSTHLVTCYNLMRNGVLVTSYIREFNPQIIKRHTSNVLDQDEREKVIQGEGLTCADRTNTIRIVGNDTKTVVRIGFEQPVESTLPYMTMHRERSKLPSTGWYIHSDYLVERTCKNSQSIVRQSTSLQLCIELDVNGLEIAKQSLKAGVTYANILEELKGYRDAWFNFRLGPPFRQPVTDSMVFQRYGQYHDEAYFEPFRAPEAGEDMIRRLPLNRIRVSSFRSPTNPSLSLDFQRSFRDFFVRPKQDLVVLIEYEGVSFTWVKIHLHHLSTAKPHSLARLPTLTLHFEEIGEVPTFHYVIWDWQSGLFLGQIISKPGSPKPTFIDKNHLLFFSYTSKSSSSDEPDIALDRPALLVYRIPITTRAVAQESVTVDGYKPLDPPPLQPILILELPKLNPEFRFSQLILWDTLIHPGDPACRRSAQAIHSYTKLVALSLSAIKIIPDENNQLSRVNYSMFVNTDPIFNRLSKIRSVETVIILWSDWGSTATRWFVDDYERDTAKTHRSTHLGFFQSLDSDNEILASIREFNPEIIKRHMSDDLDEGEREKVYQGQNLGRVLEQRDRIRIVGSDTKTFVYTGFEAPVESTLPYMVVNRVQPTRSYRWYMHSDYLIEWWGGSFLSVYQLEF